MDNFFIFFLVAATSVIAYQATRVNREFIGPKLRTALRALVDWVGTFSLFFAANLVLGVVVVLLLRTFLPRFVSLYLLENLLLLILSAAQAFVFHHWWKRG
jgi:hypothetical protein